MHSAPYFLANALTLQPYQRSSEFESVHTLAALRYLLERKKFARLVEQLPEEFKPKLISYGFRTRNLNHTHRSVERAGLTLSEVQKVRRMSPEGQRLEWQTVFVQNHDLGNLTSFFTYCEDMIHPSETSAKGCELQTFFLGHPESHNLTRLFEGCRSMFLSFRLTLP